METKRELWQFVHQANIAKYKKMLTTYLTGLERNFVEFRLAEERAALQQVVKIRAGMLNDAAYTDRGQWKH